MGLAGSVFLIAWLFSGWISMAPLGLLRGGQLSIEERQWLTGGALDADLLQHAPPHELPADVREIRWLRFAGQPLILLQSTETSRLVAPGTDKPDARTSTSAWWVVSSIEDRKSVV